VFLVDSLAQLALIEDWAKRHARRALRGDAGDRRRRRAHRLPHARRSVTLAARLRASDAVKLVGIETYEGQGATGASEPDAAYAKADGPRRSRGPPCDTQQLFETDEVLVSAGGSAIFDLVAGRLKPALGAPVRGLLRSGCYVTHDHGFYKRMVSAVDERLGCGCGESLRRRWRCGPPCSRAPSLAWRSSRWASATSPSTWSCPCPSRAPRAACCSRRTCPRAGRSPR
jgi:D-serine dehydratase